MKRISHIKIPHRRFTNLNSNSLSFDKIPSPKSYPIIGHAHLFFKKGPYCSEKLTESVLDLASKYGPIVTLRFPGRCFVFTIDAKNAFELFKNEGQYPYRGGLEGLAHYYKKNFNSVGLVPGNGKEWYRLRKFVNPLLTKSLISKFNDEHRDIAQCFVEYIKQRRNKENVLENMCSHLYLYSTECISVVCPGIRLRCIENYANDYVQKVIKGNCIFMDGVFGTYTGSRIWKYYRTNSYRKIEQGFGVIRQYVSHELQRPENEWNNPFTSSFLGSSSLSPNEKLLLATEMFAAGIDAVRMVGYFSNLIQEQPKCSLQVATIISMTLYYLSKDMDRQNIAFKDASSEPHPYLRACVKETLRMSPAAGGSSRILPRNVVMNGFEIPAGTTIIVLHSASSLLDKYFDDPLSYKPERWLKADRGVKKDEYTSFASLPFGHGSRVCPGRWISELECVTLLVEILKNFELDCATDSNVGMVFRMNRIPDRPINIRFIDRIA